MKVVTDSELSHFSENEIKSLSLVIAIRVNFTSETVVGVRCTRHNTL